MQGWVKIHRQLTNWEWYDDINVKVLFLHLLLTVNFEEKKWRGRTVKKGERITSIGKLADETGLSVQQVRTAITKLKSTSEITSQSTSGYSHITIVNWGEYQKGEEEATSQSTNVPTNEQQTSNKRITNEQQLLKNEKKDKNEKNSIATPSVAEEYDFNSSLQKFKESDDKRFPVLAAYFEAKGYNFDNKDQHVAAVQRNIRPAKLLIGYSVEQVKKTMEYLNQNADYKWTLETVGKYIDEQTAKKPEKTTEYTGAVYEGEDLGFALT